MQHYTDLISYCTLVYYSEDNEIYKSDNGTLYLAWMHSDKGLCLGLSELKDPEDIEWAIELIKEYNGV